MKKYFVWLLLLICLTGCVKDEKTLPKKEKTISPEEVLEDYQDSNTTPIGIYSLEGNTLTKLTKVTKDLQVEQDIGIFQIYPSNLDSISLPNGFANSYYEEWMKYNTEGKLHVGFQIQFHLTSGEDVSYIIRYPSDTMKRWEHLMNYLYDDYANQGKGFYSHIEDQDFHEDTLYTAIKLQSSYQISEIDSSIHLTVFTYDGEDDFDEKGEYRGNSSYTLTICRVGVACED